MKTCIPVLLLSMILASCGENSSSPSLTTEQAITSETDRLNSWLDEQFELQLDFSPQTRTVLGDKTDYGHLNDYTEVAEERNLNWLRESVATMGTEFDYAALTEDGKLSYDMWSYSLDQQERASPYRNYSFIFGRGGPQTSLPSFLISFHRIDTEEDVEAYI